MEPAIGIVVSGDPYARPAGREALDPALAAASLDLPLRVFFIGAGVLHLLAGQAPGEISAAAFTRGWAALEDLSDTVRLYAADDDLAPLLASGACLQTGVEQVGRAVMARAMSRCRVLLHV